MGGGTFTLRGDLWVQNTYDVQPNRRLTIRSGKPSPLHTKKLYICASCFAWGLESDTRQGAPYLAYALDDSRAPFIYQPASGGDQYLLPLAVNGNPTMLDLGGIPAVLEIRNGGYLELRDMLLKNIATEQDLRSPNFTSYIRPNFTRVSGMLSWPSFYAEAGASYGVYNTTQYFWSNTIFYRGDCDWQNPVTPPDSQKVNACST